MANPPDIALIGVDSLAVGGVFSEGDGVHAIPKVGEEGRVAGPSETTAMGAKTDPLVRSAAGPDGTTATAARA